MKDAAFARRSACIIVFLGAMAAWPEFGGAADPYVEGEVMVKFRNTADDVAVKQAVATHAVDVAQSYDWLAGRMKQSYALVRSKSRTTAALIAELQQDPAVEVAEPNYLRHVQGTFMPNDTLFGQMWGLHNTGQVVNGQAGVTGADAHFPEAWGLSRETGTGVVVAVVDSGADYTHPDLASNIWVNAGENPTNSLDDDGNGYTNDYHGYDFAGNSTNVTIPDADPMDSGDHGTHVSGTIAAVGQNNTGVIGVQPKARIMILKCSADGDQLPTSATTAAIQYAAMMKQRGVNIAAINASYGGGSFSTLERDAIAAAGNAGIVFCAAAGNDTINNDATPNYPSGYVLPNVVAVAATDNRDALASYSNYGATTVDLAAPGTDILSTVPVGSTQTEAYVQTTGTTYSANGLTYAAMTAGITGVLYNCGLGYATSFPVAVTGNIALIQRGTLYFSNKVANAMAAGARAAVIYNNTNGNFNGTLGSPGNWVPAVSLSQADGQALLAMGTTTVEVVNSLAIVDYELMSGTSMATPHVTGAMALMAYDFPGEAVTQRIQRIFSAVDALPALLGKVKTGGRLNLARAIDTTGDGLPDWWTAGYFGASTNGAAQADPDHDGAGNLAEWQAGTDPTNGASHLAMTTSAAHGAGGFDVRWQSVSNRYYRLDRTTNLPAGFGTTVRTNIAATPPVNTENDGTATNATPYFYRVNLEP